MPNLREKTWTTTTPANVEDAQYWEDHLISDEDAAKIGTVILPAGGTAGQVLTKQSGSPNDADWDDPASSGHTIQDEDGTDMPYQQTLQFVNAEVSNDSANDRTVVDCKGAKGDAATITVGTVSTLPAGSSATVVNSGTTKDAVFDFGIPEGADGADGADGYSPSVSITTISGGHRVTITDADHPTGQNFDVMDGANAVIPNPQGTSVGDLTSIGINGDKYDIPSGGASALANLTDVNISNPTDGQVLQYDAASQKWVNGAGGNVPPQGSTATPTDDIQTWLNCANIWDKSYTTINEVLADSTTLLALISSNNAVDYMVRSTTWASSVCANSTAMTDIGANDYCASALLSDSTWRTAICNSTYFESVLNVKVPTMTSNTSPTGYEAISSSEYGNDYKAFYCYDNSATTRWNGSNANNTEHIGIALPNSIKIYKLAFKQFFDVGNAAFKSGILQGSNDGTNWSDIQNISISNNADANTINILNNNYYTHYRILCQESYIIGASSKYCYSFYEIQIYGRASS